MSKIIRNPLRKKNLQEKGSYLPEWVRLGVAPTEVLDTSKEFQMMPKHKSKNKLAQQPISRQTVAPVQQIQGNVQVPVQNIRTKYDPNWFIKDGDPKLTKEFTAEEVPDPVFPDNILKTKLAANEQESFIVEMEDEDEEKYEEEYDESTEEPEEPEEDNLTVEILSTLKPKEYALLVHGQIVFSTFDLVEMESAIEDISYNGLNGEQIKFENISLIRRIPLKIGVLAVSCDD